MEPVVSVVLVVRNCENTIKECIDSILAQTYKNFELIVIDDCSTDRTPQVIEAYGDSRIQLVPQGSNNYIAALNLGLSIARGKYIARIDGDDIMLPNRLERQVGVLELYPNVALCHTAAQCFGDSNRIISCYDGIRATPLLDLMRYNIVAHPTAMLRKSFLVEQGLSYEEYAYAEDYKLWSEMGKLGAVFFGISEPLLRYRVSSTQVSVTKSKEQAKTSFRVQLENIEYIVAKYKLEDLYETLVSYNSRDELSANSIIQILYEVVAIRLRKANLHAEIAGEE